MLWEGRWRNQVSLDSYTNHEVFYVHSFQMVIGGGKGKCSWTTIEVPSAHEVIHLWFISCTYKYLSAVLSGSNPSFHLHMGSCWKCNFFFMHQKLGGVLCLSSAKLLFLFPHLNCRNFRKFLFLFAEWKIKYIYIYRYIHQEDARMVKVLW
jgi:hypothetical protein